VCDRAYLKDLTQTIFIVGVILGAMICTILSDKFGRKVVFLFSHWAMVIVGVANAFAPNYYVFAVFRFFSGIFFSVCSPAMFIIEFVKLLLIRYIMSNKKTHQEMR